MGISLGMRKDPVCKVPRFHYIPFTRKCEECTIVAETLNNPSVAFIILSGAWTSRGLLCLLAHKSLKSLLFIFKSSGYIVLFEHCQNFSHQALQPSPWSADWGNWSLCHDVSSNPLILLLAKLSADDSWEIEAGWSAWFPGIPTS